jgi:hypothetical protein
MNQRLHYHAPTLDSLGAIEKLTQSDPLPNQSTDGSGYGPGTPAPGS